MKCLNNELKKLKKEFDFQESKLNSLKKSSKIMKIQELDVTLKLRLDFFRFKLKKPLKNVKD